MKDHVAELGLLLAIKYDVFWFWTWQVCYETNHTVHYLPLTVIHGDGVLAGGRRLTFKLEEGCKTCNILKGGNIFVKIICGSFANNFLHFYGYEKNTPYYILALYIV